MPEEIYERKRVMSNRFSLVFVSNYINHHQVPLSNELYKVLGEKYHFVQTEAVEQERINMGWEDVASKLPYVRIYQDNPEENQKLIMEADVVVFGGTDDESYIMPRLEAGKPVIRYSERIYKTGRWKFISPRGLVKKYHDHIRFRNNPVYLLCAGGYVAGDFRLIGAYPKKKYKWGYFPETKEYDIEKLIAHKRELTEQNGGKVSILWAGRLIDWKHPEMAIKLADELRGLDYKFHLNLIGGGKMEPELQQMVKNKQLDSFVTFAGYKTPQEVRRYMEDSEIFIFTSDRQEGWGAVLNEAMNSGCACVVSHHIGAAPYLIKDKDNGFLFRSIHQRDLRRKVEKLISDSTLRKQLGRKAYESVLHTWNAREAAGVLLDMGHQIIEGVKPEYRVEGPGSEV